jgi:DNA-binding MarR family transcriptional regulator
LRFSGIQLLSKKNSTTEVSQSICEAALELYGASDNSLAERIRQASIEVRDFIILSFICDQQSMSIDQIGRVLGVDEETAQLCVDRLIKATLVQYGPAGDDSGSRQDVCPTDIGQAVTNHIHSETL